MKDLKKILEEKRAILSGHFLLSSGLHSPNYVQCALALSDTALSKKLGKELAKKWKGTKPDLIVSPAMGGIIIGHETASAMKIPFLFTERENGEMKLRRGFSVEKGQKIIIVEDVFTTGKSTMEVVNLLKKYKAKVLGALSVVNRMGDKKLPLKNFSLLKLEIKTYTPEECPLCKQGLPCVKPGSRK